MNELLEIINDVPVRNYRNAIWFKASPLVTKYFNRSLVSQFVVHLTEGVDYRDFAIRRVGKARKRDIWISVNGLLKSILITSEEVVNPDIKYMRVALLSILKDLLTSSDAYSALLLKYPAGSHSTSRRISQDVDLDIVRKNIQKFFRKDRRWDSYFSAAELYPKIRVLQSPDGKNNLEYATGILETLVKEGFLRSSTKPTTKTRTYNISQFYLKLDLKTDLNES